MIHSDVKRLYDISGVNPARAGMILAEVYGRYIKNRKPRACGDDPNGYSLTVAPTG